uniref:Zona occludens toxin N-terminal domain-containing protein n=1 Tax=Globodera rostochiensis TaxID=31243 RepID=A0A914I0M2_GLORO
MIVSGSTGSGKSEWIMRLLRNFDKMRAGKIGSVPVTVHNGVPTEEQIRERAKLGRMLLIFDDLVVGMNRHFLDTLFTRGSHNWGVSVILVTQHLFTKELRIARNNIHYLLLMRNPAEAYRDACAKNFGYLLVDMHQESSEALRLRTHMIFAKTVASSVPKHNWFAKRPMNSCYAWWKFA